MEISKVNAVGLTILSILLISYNLSIDDDIIYCGTITDIESFSLKSVQTDFLVIKINNNKTIKVPGTEHYQAIGKPVEIIETTNLLGKKTYKIINNAQSNNMSHIKRQC